MSNTYYDAWSNTKTKNGLEADLVISSLQKCIRRGNEDTALRMAFELYMTSPFHEDKMWNRLLVMPVEDIGFGDDNAAAFVKTMFDLHKEFPYGDGDRPIFFVHAIRYMCKAKKERSSDHIKNILMKDFDNDNIYVYSLDLDALSNAAYNPIIQKEEGDVKTLDASKYPFIHKAEIFSHNDDDAIIYYANSDALHMYDIAGNQEIPNIATFPGEEITFVKHIYMQDKNETDEDANFDYIVIATHKDGKYKVYMYEIYLGKPDLTKEVKMFSGSGKIADMHYVSTRHGDYSDYPY